LRDREGYAHKKAGASKTKRENRKTRMRALKNYRNWNKYVSPLPTTSWLIQKNDLSSRIVSDGLEL